MILFAGEFVKGLTNQIFTLYSIHAERDMSPKGSLTGSVEHSLMKRHGTEAAEIESYYSVPATLCIEGNDRSL